MPSDSLAHLQMVVQIAQSVTDKPDREAVVLVRVGSTAGYQELS